MPELPEVETVVRVIRPLIVGRKITGSRFQIPRQLLPQTSGQVKRGIEGKRIESVERRGKFILIHLDEGLLLIHLRMTGRLYVKDADEDLQNHERAYFELGSQYRLVFNDPRTLGTISYLRNPEDALSLTRLGWDPLSDCVTVKEVREILDKRSVAIKVLLLNQSVWSGIGNIYASEILWEAGIHPEKASRLLTIRQTVALLDAIPLVLNRALDKGGSTLRDFMSAEGKSGSYQKEFRVYGRDGKPCLRCGKSIKRIVQAQRSTYYCAGCQKKR